MGIGVWQPEIDLLGNFGQSPEIVQARAPRIREFGSFPAEVFPRLIDVPGGEKLGASQHNYRRAGPLINESFSSPSCYAADFRFFCLGQVIL